MSVGVHISHGEIAVGAKENFIASASEKAPFVNFADLSNDIDIENYANPCEFYQTVLDGEAEPIPSSLQDMGYWSEQITLNDGSFASPIRLEFSAPELFSSSGITLEFDTLNGIHPTRMLVEWYNGEDLLSSMEFEPDSALYFCKNRVDLYNRLHITVYSLNMPYNRLKIRSIQYGFVLEIDAEDITRISLEQKIDVLSAELPISTVSYAFKSSKGADFIFQEKQPITVMFDGDVISKCFVKSAKRLDKFNWSVKAEESVGLLEQGKFLGGIYVRKNAKQLIDEIMLSAKVDYEIDNIEDEVYVSGYLPISSCRLALQQVLFAIGAVIKTASREKPLITRLDDEVSQEITLDRIGQGQAYNSNNIVTAVEVVSHQYVLSQDEKEVYKSNGASQTNVLVEFIEPLSDLRIEDGVILESGVNYALINAGENCVLYGKPYVDTRHTLSQRNPNTGYANAENIVRIDKATLITQDNAQETLERCFLECLKTDTVDVAIIEGKSEVYEGYAQYGNALYGQAKYGSPAETISVNDTATSVGDLIRCETEYKGFVGGRIISQKFNLSGNIKIKQSVLKKE